MHNWRRDHHTEAEKVIDHLYRVFLGYKAAVRRPVLQAMLLHLDNKFLRDGAICHLESKHIGAGVYHVWMVKD